MADDTRGSLGPQADTVPAPVEGRDEPKPDGERYRLGAELGRGGMGRVVEAFDTQLHRVVALKEVLAKAGANAERRFAREVQITARLEHASIVPLYDAGTTADGRPYYVMRRVSGKPFDQLITGAKDLSERLALLPNLLSAIDAIAHAHTRGVIHRDLKPQNILVGELGETVVIDWGLAKVIGEEDDSQEPRVPSAGESLQTQVGSVFGTPGFMAPEQARGDDLGPRSDVFALGATLYALLAGRPPVTGKSATEMIEATHKHAIVPVAQVCSGAPAELVAIVDKALAFEPTARYPNATALAEDVRRFLTGQLVAAHRYTRLERLVRFTRRHRAVLSVAALGAAIVATLAWVGVHRIVRERDAANVAEAHAQAEKREVDAANVKLEDNADQLRVDQARLLLAQNPTQALAVLKHVRPQFARLDEARAVAQAAVARGVAWALDTGPEPVIAAELSPDGARLVTADVLGELRVYDLEARRLAWTKKLARGARGAWVDDGKRLLVFGLPTPAQLVEPRDGSALPATLPAMRFAELTEHGDRAIYYDDAYVAGVVDLATQQAHVLPIGHVVELAISPDGSWLAVASDKRLAVFDRDGREVAHQDGRGMIVAAARRRLATLSNDRVRELVLDPQPVWTDLAVPLEPKHHVLQIEYRGDDLTVSTTAGELFVHAGTAMQRRNIDPQLVWRSVPVRDVLVAIGEDGKLHYTSGISSGAVALPSAIANPRVVGRAGQSRFAVVGPGALFVYEADDFLPRRLDAPARQVAFVDDDLVVVHHQGPDWSWYDLAAGKPVDAPVPDWGWGMAFLLDVDGAERRVLRAIETQTDGKSHLSVMRPGTPDRELAVVDSQFFHTMKIPPRIAALVSGDAVVWADGARVMAQIGDGPAREIAKLDGDVVAVIGLGRLQFAALSVRGELARGAVGGCALARAHADIHGFARLAIDRDGRVVIAAGRDLFVWGSDVRRLAQLAQGIVAIAIVEGGIAAVLENEVDLVPPTGAPKRVLGHVTPAASRDGHLLVATGNGQQIELLELPAQARWTLPWLYGGAFHGLAVSPSARRVVQATGQALALWKLPDARGNFADWLADRTNACATQDGVAWPWEHACP